MNKRLIASMSCAALLLSSTSLAANANSLKVTNVVDVVTAATTAAPTPGSPSTQWTPKPIQVVENATEITRLLALNSVGGDVSLLQALLISNGYVLKVDGIYGVKTLAAVESFQGKNGLRVDGIVGPKTLAKLAPFVAEVVKPVEPTEPVTPVEPEKPVTPVEPSEPVDAVTSASIVDNATAFEKAMSKDGSWIIGALNDITFEKDLVLEGEFTYKEKIQRKIALYTQDDKKVTTAKFTLTAPKLTIKSPGASIQKGTFKGDLYVEVPDFKLVDAIIEGNVYFTTQEAMDTFAPDATSSVTGVQELKTK